MRIILKSVVAGFAALAAASLMADYLPWTVDETVSGGHEYDYAQIYYAESIDNLGTALNNYYSNALTYPSDYDTADITKVGSGDLDGEMTMFADLSGISSSDGYSFYILLYKNDSVIGYLNDGTTYDSLAKVGEYSPYSGNAVTGGTFAGASFGDGVGFTIPEPSSGLLVLVGSIALLLRRKREA